jgi:hypothetical protein
MLPKALLLNQDGTILGFVPAKKSIRLLYKEKAEIISIWDGIEFNSVGGVRIRLPSVLKMTYYVYKKHTKVPFSRKAVLKRDKFTCSYCLKSLTLSTGTIDHIRPYKLGGKSSFDNCVASCLKCNSRKSHLTIEEAGMTLINKPFVPSTHTHYLADDDIWHPEWKRYLK